MHPHYFLVWLGLYLSQIGWDQGDRGIHRIIWTSFLWLRFVCTNRQPSTLVKMHLQYFLCAWAKFGQIREIRVSMESGEHADTVWPNKITQVLANISVKLHQIRDMRVSMKSGKHVGLISGDNMTQSHVNLVIVHAEAHNSAKSGQTVKINVSMKSQDHSTYIILFWSWKGSKV